MSSLTPAQPPHQPAQPVRPAQPAPAPASVPAYLVPATGGALVTAGGILLTLLLFVIGFVGFLIAPWIVLGVAGAAYWIRTASSRERGARRPAPGAPGGGPAPDQTPGGFGGGLR